MSRSITLLLIICTLSLSLVSLSSCNMPVLDYEAFTTAESDAADPSFSENEPYNIQYLFYADEEDYCAANIIINPAYTEEFSITVPEKTPDGITVREVVSTTEALMYPNIPRILFKDQFDNILSKIEAKIDLNDPNDEFAFRKFKSYFTELDLEKIFDETTKETYLNKYPLLEIDPIVIIDTLVFSGANLYNSTESILKHLSYAEYTPKSHYADVAEINSRIKESGKDIAPIEFYSAANVTKIELPSSIEVIKEGAFKNFENLKEINIPDSVTEIGFSAFEGCISLESISLPSGVDALSRETFKNCINLKSITLSENTRYIEKNAFYNCSKLEGTVYDNGLYLQIGNNPYAVLVNLTRKSAQSIKIHNDTQIIAPGFAPFTQDPTDPLYDSHLANSFKMTFENPNGWTAYGDYQSVKDNNGKVILAEDLESYAKMKYTEFPNCCWIHK